MIVPQPCNLAHHFTLSLCLIVKPYPPSPFPFEFSATTTWLPHTHQDEIFISTATEDTTKDSTDQRPCGRHASISRSRSYHFSAYSRVQRCSQSYAQGWLRRQHCRLLLGTRRCDRHCPLVTASTFAVKTSWPKVSTSQCAPLRSAHADARSSLNNIQSRSNLTSGHIARSKHARSYSSTSASNSTGNSQSSAKAGRIASIAIAGLGTVLLVDWYLSQGHCNPNRKWLQPRRSKETEHKALLHPSKKMTKISIVATLSFVLSSRSAT